MPSHNMIIRSVENILIVGFGMIILMVFGNVVLRYAFNSGITASEELSRVIFVWLTFGGAFLVAKDGGHLGMTTIVAKIGRNGQWACRLAAESLSLFCMALLIVGCWQQSVINMGNHAPVTGIPLAVNYIAGLVCGLGIGALNAIAVFRLLTGRMPDGELVTGVESEEFAAFEARQAKEKRK